MPSAGCWASPGESRHRNRGRDMTRDDRIAALKAPAKERILVLDGAMGTMIQRYKLDEADFRGERFTDHRPRSEGQQRPPVPDASPTSSATCTTPISPPAPTSSRPTPSTPPRSARPTTGWPTSPYELNLAAAQARARGGRRAGPRRRRTSRASSPAPSARPTARSRSRPT